MGKDMVLSPGVQAILAHTGKQRSFLRNEEIRASKRAGKGGIEIAVNLTSYRALPLSCIEGLQLSIDGKKIKSAQCSLVLNGNVYALAEMAELSDIWWFILDPARLFVPMEEALTAGEHRVEATLITVEPYVTAGRFSLYHLDAKTLSFSKEEMA